MGEPHRATTLRINTAESEAFPLSMKGAVHPQRPGPGIMSVDRRSYQNRKKSGVLSTLQRRDHASASERSRYYPTGTSRAGLHQRIGAEKDHRPKARQPLDPW